MKKIKLKYTQKNSCLYCASLKFRCVKLDDNISTKCKRCTCLNIKCTKKRRTTTNLLDEINILTKQIIKLKEIIDLKNNQINNNNNNNK